MTVHWRPGLVECGHCGKMVRGRLDHIRAVHQQPFYAYGPDGKFYDYWHLRKVDVSLVVDNPLWNQVYEQLEREGKTMSTNDGSWRESV